MFDIGFWELLIIGMVALLVVGPDRLPGMATFIGHWVGRARRFTNHMRREIQEEFEAEQLKSLVNEQQRELNSLRQEVEGVRDEATTAARDIERDFGDTGQAGPRSQAVPDPDSSSTTAAGDGSGANEGTVESSATSPGQTVGESEAATNAGRKKSSAKKSAAKKQSAKKAASKKKAGARTKSAAKKKTTARSRPAETPSSDTIGEGGGDVADDTGDADR